MTSKQGNDPGKLADNPDSGRAICDALWLHRICSKATCRRARVCRGVGVLCIRDHGQIVPEEVWEWVCAILDARDEGLSHDEIMESIESLKGAYFGWLAGIEAGLTARRS
jgi:hypothetical protein